MATTVRPTIDANATGARATGPDGFVFQGVTLLRRLLPSEQISNAAPLTLYAAIRDTYGVDLADYRRGAEGLDSVESKALRYAALERAAYQMGVADGAMSVDAAAEMDGLTPESYGELMRRVADLPHGHHPAEEAVYAAYRTGMRVAAGTTYATMKAPGRVRTERALAAANESPADPSLALEALTQATEEAQSARRGDVEGHAMSYTRLGMARDVADRTTVGAMRLALARISSVTPGITTEAAIAEARLGFRRAAAQGESAVGALAWAPVSFAEAERVVAEQQAPRVPKSMARR